MASAVSGAAVNLKEAGPAVVIPVVAAELWVGSSSPEQ